MPFGNKEYLLHMLPSLQIKGLLRKFIGARERENLKVLTNSIKEKDKFLHF